MLDPSDVITNRKLLVAFYGGSLPGKEEINMVGEAVSYMAEPTYGIQGKNRRLDWAASLVREATPEEAIAYWRERALMAEERVNSATGT